MRCPHCKNKLLQKSGSTTKLRLQGLIVFNEDGTCLSKCYWCKQDVEIPILIKSDVKVQHESFIIKRIKKEQSLKKSD